MKWFCFTYVSTFHSFSFNNNMISDNYGIVHILINYTVLQISQPINIEFCCCCQGNSIRRGFMQLGRYFASTKPFMPY